MENISVLICLILSIIFCLLILLFSYFLGNKSISKNRNLPFESGIYSYKKNNLKLFIQFYLIAMFFVIFDTESLYLYTWSLSIKENMWYGFFESLFFVFTILLGLLYIIKLNIFSFNKSK
ncbi:NADH-quinone oxidoreductase subunit A [Buchnera aphidicola (Ceratoglyphina bambusae)]|uniref:NADH-quinone oxidoreductase subunit A n=1 Tax=Buchnera aphidicola TaxID=9 RepID=UPI0031B888E3